MLKIVFQNKKWHSDDVLVLPSRFGDIPIKLQVGCFPKRDVSSKGVKKPRHLKKNEMV